jgi:flagellar motor switch/type III secretory pathway protein FliN
MTRARSNRWLKNRITPLPTAPQPESRAGPDPQGLPLEIGSTPPAGGGENLDLLLDIPLEITIELGRTRMLINDLLKLGQGP